MTKAKVGAGNISITLGGKDYDLVPTLSAAQGVSRQAGGLRSAIDAIMKMDLDVITRIVQLGLGPKVTKDIGSEKIPQLVFESGMTDSSGALAVKCIEYLTVLSNGGRPITPDDLGDEGDTRDPQ